MSQSSDALLIGLLLTAPPNPYLRRRSSEHRRRRHHDAGPEQEPEADAARALPQHGGHPGRPVPQARLPPRSPRRRRRRRGAQAAAAPEGRHGRGLPRARGTGRGPPGPPGTALLLCALPRAEWIGLPLLVGLGVG